RRYDITVDANGIPQPSTPKDSNTLFFTYATAMVNGAPMDPSFRLTNGQHIIGLLSVPKYHYLSNPPPNTIRFYSNYIVAAVRSISGAANEKAPQSNPDVLGLALSYRLVPEITRNLADGYDPGTLQPAHPPFYYDWTNYAQPGITADARNARSNFWMIA